MTLFVPKSPDYVESNDNEKRYGMVRLHGCATAFSLYSTPVILLSQRDRINSGRLGKLSPHTYFDIFSSLQTPTTKTQISWSFHLPQSLPLFLSFPRHRPLASCVVRLISILYKYNTGTKKHIFSRRTRCTFILIYGHLWNSTPLLIILKDLKCEYRLIDWALRLYLNTRKALMASLAVVPSSTQ